MSLLEANFTDFMMINKIREPDGYGGTVTRWQDGAPFSGAIVYDGSSQMLVAQAMGSKSTYVLTVRKDVQLDYHDVIRHETDGKIFRITQNSDDLKTPNGAGLNMRQYRAEEWELTE